MRQVFFSYSNTESDLVEQIATELERHGYTTWYYHRDAVLALSHLHQTIQAIKRCEAVTLLISLRAIQSNEVAREVQSAHDRAKRFVPILVDMSEDQFREEDVEWEQAVSGIVKVSVPTAGAVALVPKIVTGLVSLGIQPADRRDAPPLPPVDPKPAGDESPSREGFGAVPPATPDSALPCGYENLYRMAGVSFPYIVLFDSRETGVGEYEFGHISVRIRDDVFKLPEDFERNPVPANFQKLLDLGRGPEHFIKCRFDEYTRNPAGVGTLTFGLSKTTYIDYLRSGEHLDTPVSDRSALTFRQKYVPTLDAIASPEAPRRDFRCSPLTNICGVGIFLITADGKVIVSRHSRDLTVYPGRCSYSASGTMEWSDDPSTLHPFEQIVRECREEIAHEVDVDNLRLFGLGIDATKFYFQFSFLEYVDVAASEIIGRATTARDWLEMEALAAVPLEVGEVTRWAHGRTWEPSAGATFLSLCARELGNEELEWALSPDEVRRAWRERVTNEWRRRATRVGESAVMSTRYPSDAIRWASGKYVEAVKDFIGDDLDGKDVLEIGAGNGRITEFLVQKAVRLTCIDLSEDMLRRNRERLGDHHRDVQYVHDFAQNYRGHHDAVVSSLVLIHNVPRQAFNELVKMMHETAATLFLCEHADVGGRRTRHTRVRREEELLSAFSDYRVERRAEHDLFDDRVVLLKLRRG